MKKFVASIVALGIPALCLAQAPEYTRPSGDLEYREVTTSELVFETPQGDMTMTSNHDALIAVSIAADGTAEASYRELALSMDMPQGVVAPDTDPIVGDKFNLVFPADGRVSTIETPSFSDEITTVSDLTFQFFDFFMRLPNETWSPGFTWTDTLTHVDDEMDLWQETDFRVLGDTTIGTDRATIISYVANSVIEVALPEPEPGITGSMSQSGSETGRFYFSVERGVMIGRDREGSQTGTMEFVGGPEPFEMNQGMSYTSSIRLVQTP